MAFSNTYDTTNPGSAVGNREQIADLVSILEPENTPLYSLGKKSKATATFPEHVLDKLDDPSAPAIVEGADTSSFDDKFAGRAKIGNRVQTFEKNWMVSKQQQAVTSVGPADYAQAKSKAFRELKRNVEFAIASDNDLQAEDGQGNGGRLRGLGNWLDSSGPSDVPADYRTPANSISTQGVSINEDEFNTLLQSRFDQTGTAEQLTAVLDSALRRTVSNFMLSEGGASQTRYSVNVNGESRKFTLSCKIFDSDFGLVRVVNSNPDCSPVAGGVLDRGYIVDPAHLEIKELIPMGEKPLPDNGGGPRGLVDCALTICVDPRAHAKIS